MRSDLEAIVIGGGFYGAAIALYLKKNRGFSKVTIIEKESALLSRASYNNQARAHNGYHYPRSFTTAYRSCINLPKFMKDYARSLKTDFTKIYATARMNSRITTKQFVRFCREIGAKLEPAPQNVKQLFDPRTIDEVFLVEEYAFNAHILAEIIAKQLADEKIEVVLNSRVLSLKKIKDERILVVYEKDQRHILEVQIDKVFNCTYSGLNQIRGDFPEIKTLLKHEITEMALVDVPQIIKNIGITVVDGPFFSLMPFPPKGLHTLSHVRYTPHVSWLDAKNLDPYQKLSEYECQTRVDRMIKDSARYMPCILDVQYKSSIFEVKTVLAKSESNDGRPICFEKFENMPGCFSILGGKIDNIYDIFDKLEMEHF